MAKVSIFMGSISDKDAVAPCAEILQKLGISHKINVTSAHRTPARTIKLIRALEADGCEVFICAAGMAAHLAGVVAAHTIKPVIGIPITASSLNGLDAMLSTLMMPAGFPVATVALDKAGARNAAWLAAQILAINDSALAAKLERARDEFEKAVEKAAEELNKE